MSKKNKKEEEIVFKIITIGDSNVGKTSIIRRYLYNVFESSNLATIGVAFSFKEVTLENGQIIKLRLVDTAGQEKFKSVTKSYYKNTDGVLFVFDYNNPLTFENISEWIQSFEENHNGKENIPRFLLGNKSDLEHKVTDEMINNFLNQHKDKYKFESTSALENTNIDKIFQELAEEIYKIYLTSSKKEQKKITINKYKKEKSRRNNCICSMDSG